MKVNLGGISSSLFESEMFGHRRGAFTDAKTDRVGRFELANGGTIFLDEIGELEMASQVKLLRVLQDRTYEVLGDSKPRRLDIPGLLLGTGGLFSLTYALIEANQKGWSDPSIVATLIGGAVMPLLGGDSHGSEHTVRTELLIDRSFARNGCARH